MENGFFTLHEFMLHTKGITYLLVIAILIGMAGFWRFLSKENDENGDRVLK